MKTFFLILSLLTCTGVIWNYCRARIRGFVTTSYTVSVRALAVLNVAMAVGALAHNYIVRGIAIIVWLISLGSFSAATYLYIEEKKARAMFEEIIKESKKNTDEQDDDDDNDDVRTTI